MLLRSFKPSTSNLGRSDSKAEKSKKKKPKKSPKAAQKKSPKTGAESDDGKPVSRKTKSTDDLKNKSNKKKK